jgi:hypothetical protein
LELIESSLGHDREKNDAPFENRMSEARRLGFGCADGIEFVDIKYFPLLLLFGLLLIRLDDDSPLGCFIIVVVKIVVVVVVVVVVVDDIFVGEWSGCDCDCGGGTGDTDIIEDESDWDVVVDVVEFRDLFDFDFASPLPPNTTLSRLEGD